MLLEEQNKHPRDSQISFQEEGHIYNINGDTSYTSTTTWVKSFFEEFNPDKVIYKMMSSNKWSSSKYFGKTKQQIKDLWRQDGQKASELGTKLHNDIEKFYNNLEYDNNTEEFSYFLNFVKEHQNLKPYRTEWYVWDEDIKICGSIDMVFENEDGELIIIDWKRCKEIKKEDSWGKKSICKTIGHLNDLNYWHYSLQLNIYKAILERSYGKTIKELYLVCLHPCNINKNYQKIKVPDLEKEVLSLFEERMNEINYIDVEEKVKDGIVYLVDENNNIYNENGEITGKWTE